MTPLSLPTINYLAILPELIVLGGALLLMLATALTRSRLSATVATTSTVLVGVAVGVVGLFQWHSLVQHRQHHHVGPRRGPRRLLLLATGVLAAALVSWPWWLTTGWCVGDRWRRVPRAGACGHVGRHDHDPGQRPAGHLPRTGNPLHRALRLGGLRSLPGGLAEAALKYFLLGGFASAIFITAWRSRTAPPARRR
jgi:hypothetical protein